MQVGVISRDVRVSLDAQKRRMVLFCRKTGKFSLYRRTVATRARVRTRRDTRAVTRKV